MGTVNRPQKPALFLILGIIIGVIFTHLYNSSQQKDSYNPQTGERTITFRDDQVVTIITIEQHLENLRALHAFYSQILKMYRNGEEPTGRVFLLQRSVGQGVKPFDAADIEALEEEIATIESLIQKGEEQLAKSHHHKRKSPQEDPVQRLQTNDDDDEEEGDDDEDNSSSAVKQEDDDEDDEEGGDDEEDDDEEDE